MNLRDFLAWTEREGKLVKVSRPADPHLEMARVIHALDGRPVLFGDPRWPDWRVVAGVCAQREHFAWALSTDLPGIVPRLVAALNQPTTPPTVGNAPCQEVVANDIRAMEGRWRPTRH